MPALPLPTPDDDNLRGRGRPRDEEARSRILQASLDALEDLGYPGITCDSIAERAGASKATIYRWWPHKEAVMLEALRESVGLELPFPDTGDLESDIRIQLRNFVKLMTSPRGRVIKAIISAAQSDAKVAEAFCSIWVHPRRELSRQGLERHRHLFRPGVDLRVVLDQLYGPIYYRLLIGHEKLTLAFADEIADMALASLIQHQNGRKSMSPVPIG